MPCSIAAKTRNQLKFAGVPQMVEPISAVSRPKFTILWGHVEDILMLNKFFPVVDRCLSCEDIARQICVMVPKWRFLATFLRSVFSESRVQHISDLHSKFALRPQHVWKYGGHPISDHWDQARKKRRKKQAENIMVCPITYGDHKDRKKPQDENIMVCLFHRVTIKNTLCLSSPDICPPPGHLRRKMPSRQSALGQMPFSS